MTPPEKIAGIFGTDLIKEYTSNSNDTVVLKVRKNNEYFILKRKVTTNGKSTCAKKEIEALEALKDVDFVPNLYDVFEKDKKTYYLKQFMKEIELYDYSKYFKLDFLKNKSYFKEELSRMTKIIHERGFSYVDPFITNVAIIPDIKKLSFFDLDLCVYKDDEEYAQGIDFDNTMIRILGLID